MEMADRDWELLSSLLPVNWRELAAETGALKGLRKDKSADNLLRLFMGRSAFSGWLLTVLSMRAGVSRRTPVRPLAGRRCRRACPRLATAACLRG